MVLGMLVWYGSGAEDRMGVVTSGRILRRQTRVDGEGLVGVKRSHNNSNVI